MTELYERLAARVRDRREAARMSQHELAARAGLSRSQIANIENGRQRPPIEAIYKISRGLSIPLDEILPPPEEFESAERVDIGGGLTATPRFAGFLRELDATSSS